MRLEKTISDALDRVNKDRYLLSNMVFKRVDQLGAGAKPLIKGVDIKKDKLTDIAIREIAEGLIEIDKSK